MAAAAVMFAVGASSAAALTPPPPAPVGFGVPTISGIQGSGFEQDVRVDPVGRIYSSAPDSLSSATSWIWRSLDGGRTFKYIPAASQPTGKVPGCAGGGDSELAVDGRGRLYFNDLTLANFSTARSDDQGRTFAAASCTGVPDPGVDRQWYAILGDPVEGGSIFLAYDRVDQGNPGQCTNGSSGGNILVVAQSPVPNGGAAAGVQFGPSQVLTCDEGIMGPDQAFDYTHGGRRVFVPHDNRALDSVSVSRCDVIGIGPASLTGFSNCRDVLVSAFPGYRTGANFPTLTVDRAGNLFMIWEEAPHAAAGVKGDTLLYYSVSTDQGTSWSRAAVLPTPGLHTNVMAWPAAGDSGRIDVAWYGAPQGFSGTAGPDSTRGDYGVYVVQTLDLGRTWSKPVLASRHFVHRGTMFTLIGGQTGDRSIGDYMQVRMGTLGEAVISYGDSNNVNESLDPQPMVVRQNSGPSLLRSVGTVRLPASPRNSVVVGPHSATFDNLGQSSADLPNLHLTSSAMSRPDPAHIRIQMGVADLTSLTPSATAGGPYEVWLTQWQVPSKTDTNGGNVYFAYMESAGGQAPTCWVGQLAATVSGGGVLTTYPGTTQLPAAACTYTATKPGLITITVPVALVAEASPLSSTLFSVTSHTATLAGRSNTPVFAGLGGTPFNLIDVAPAYDFTG